MTDADREWIIDAREQACGQCGGEYRSISQHWTRSADCEFRDLTDHQHETVRGLLLGDGSLGGRESPNLRVESVRREHIAWLHDELGWLSRGVSRFEKDGSTVYRLTTMSHPDLARYLAWRSAPPQSGWTLTRQAARVWYACDGSLSAAGRGGDTPQISFAAMDDGKRAALVAALDRARFAARSWERRVGLAESAVSRWLDWLGGPTPGSEHKWPAEGDSDETYDERACRHALRRVATLCDADRLTMRQYDRRRWGAEPSTKTIIRRLGDNSWNVATAAVGLEPHPASGGRAVAHTTSDCERALRLAAIGCGLGPGGTLTQGMYRGWRSGRGDPTEHPGYLIVADKLGDGSWPDAVTSVGLTAGSPGKDEGYDLPSHTDADCWAAVRRVAAALGHAPTQAEYGRERTDEEPARKTITGHLGSWTAVKETVADE